MKWGSVVRQWIDISSIEYCLEVVYLSSSFESRFENDGCRMWSYLMSSAYQIKISSSSSCTPHLLQLCSGEDDIKIWGTSWQQGHSPRRVLAQSIIVITIRNDGEQALFLDKVNRRWNKYWCGTVFISLHFISLQLCCLLYWNKSFWRISINVLKIHD